MERQEVFARFADLRRLASTIPPYLAKQVGVDETPTLRTTVEDDFGLAGLDTESLIIEFSEKYQVDLSQFDFTGFISSEGPDSIIGGYIAVIAMLLVFPVWLCKLLIALLFWPFSKSMATSISEFSTIGFFSSHKPRPLSEVLTTGDFVASAALGRFVKREQVRFTFVK
jgi:hypothetical protein